jgi:hypothetical protein
MNAIIIYWSSTGNTEKVARAMAAGLEQTGLNVRLTTVADAGDVDFYAWDLVGMGFPSYQWMPPRPVDDFIRGKFAEYRGQGRVKIGSPPLPGKNALIFCTYSGPHTGIREAVPAVLYMGQFFEHLGFTVREERCVVGEYHGSEEFSTLGRLGDIRGRPNAEDIRKVTADAARLARDMLGPEAGPPR